MSHEIYKIFGVSMLSLTSLRLQIVDKSIKKPGFPFLATSRALTDSKEYEIKFQVNNDMVTFAAGKGFEMPKDYKNILEIDDPKFNTNSGDHNQKVEPSTQNQKENK
ncbi:hypothetical protein HAX54_052169 [Datura stramonium]|uniref:Uncharacterized protein n=1 Tax=Datura stramonium TaxID=4076 RepID=A0ABS8SZJ2_DATST|nr:hypothetical protein [Datura stramonium]